MRKIFQEINGYNIREKVLLCLYIIGIMSLGLLAINQFLEFRYMNYLMQTPCDLCQELNPHIELCPRVKVDFDMVNLSSIG